MHISRYGQLLVVVGTGVRRPGESVGCWAGHTLCRQVRHHFLFIKFIKAEIIATLSADVEILDKRNDTRADLKLYVADLGNVFLFQICIFKVYATLVALRNDI